MFRSCQHAKTAWFCLGSVFRQSFVLFCPCQHQVAIRYKVFLDNGQKMKFKNYKSAIHNFAHSFMSIDYMKSGQLAVNVLINRYNLKMEPEATFDFINKTIMKK